MSNENSQNENKNSAFSEDFVPESKVSSEDEKQFIQEFVALTKAGVLIKTDKVSIRAFALNDNTTVLCYILAELDDSFVVIFPSIVSISGTSIVRCTTISPIPMTRLLKSSIKLVGIPPSKYIFYYLFATQDKFSLIPGYFNENRTNQIRSLISVMKEDLNIESITNTPVTEDSQVKPTSTENSSFSNIDFDGINYHVSGPVNKKYPRH
jgi:hypothetical protein